MTGANRLFLQPRVFIPFAIITLIWGSTWLVITGQLGVVPPTWSITYRFAIGSAVMFAFTALSGASLRIGRQGHLLALAFGLPQFSLNFNCVYFAEQHVTSGLVAVVFALLLVPNSLFAWLFLGHRISRRFLVGSQLGGPDLQALQRPALLGVKNRSGGNQWAAPRSRGDSNSDFTPRGSIECRAGVSATASHR